MTLDAFIIVALTIAMMYGVYIWLKPNKPKEGSTEHLVQVTAEKVIVQQVADLDIYQTPAAIRQEVEEELEVSTMEDLLAEGLTPQQARAELRAQRRDVREQIALEKELDKKNRREQAAIERLARENRAEERAKARLRTQQTRLAMDVGKTVFRALSK